MTSFPPIQTTDSGTSQYMIIPGGYIGTEAVQYNGLNYQLKTPGNTAHTNQRQDHAAGVSYFRRPVQASREADKLSPAQPPMPETDNEPAGLNMKRKTDDNQDELSRPKGKRTFLTGKQLIELMKDLEKPENERQSDTELAIKFGLCENTVYKRRTKMGIYKVRGKSVRLPLAKELELTEVLEKPENDRPSYEELAQQFNQTAISIRKRSIRMKRSPQLAVAQKRKLQERINVENEFKKKVDGKEKKSLKQLAGELNLTKREIMNLWRMWRRRTQKEPAEPAKTVPGTTGKGAAKPTKPVSGTTEKRTAKPTKPVSGTTEKRTAKPTKPVSETSGKGAAQPPIVNWLINDL